MPRTPRVIVLDGAASPGLVASLDGWRRAGAAVAVVSRSVSGSPQNLVEQLDAARGDVIALWGANQALVHALARSLMHPRTPVVAFLEAAEGLVHPLALDHPFFEDLRGSAVVSQPPAVATWLGALWSDPCVHFVFRSEWHRDAVVQGVGNEGLARSTVIAPPLATSAPKEARPMRLYFSGRVDAARRYGADVFVRTVLELSHRRQGFEVVVDDDAVDDARVLKPLAAVPMRRLAHHEALATATVALVTARDATRVRHALECAAHGVVPVTTTHPALTERFGSDIGVAEDPWVLAQAVDALLAQPQRRAELQSRLQGALRVACEPKAAAAAELDVLGATPRVVLARAPSAAAPRLTVAVPAFNAERFLERCVASLVRADARAQVEVLVIDDGSTDGTGAQADALAREYSTVRVVHQDNRGHGGAINTALREARGRYFRVVDADDWVASAAFAQLVSALEHEHVDLVLTSYAEDRPSADLSKPIDLLGRLPPGAVCRFDTALDPLYGFTSWGPLLSTSTFRTECLRRAGLVVTEGSAYVDLEYCTLGLKHVETMRHWPLDVYQYSLDVAGQSVSVESYRKRFRQHEAVITRLCEFVRDTQGLSEAKRRYIVERVIAPVVAAHLDVLTVKLGSQREARAFRQRMRAFAFVPLPRKGPVRAAAVKTLKAALPQGLVTALEQSKERSPAAVAREVSRFMLPAFLGRFFTR